MTVLRFKCGHAILQRERHEVGVKRYAVGRKGGRYGQNDADAEQPLFQCGKYSAAVRWAKAQPAPPASPVL